MHCGVCRQWDLYEQCIGYQKSKVLPAAHKSADTVSTASRM